ncbi:acetyl-CoA C-acetyltransferase [Paenibacillus sp. NEAU-GSW1]|uniref:acetyl-CoA C-acetyltransferase n=1 Tax=Paenibacillus sp. NEAU-GSW1 TaxID=2682486 RepID=UPI0012E2AD43|nr:acetyl-CoA C-acetyltransferase [Paenibacillus sp. NEAU-GSW1]MUT68717.1 acetyl-CoA C-acetyltransferase [Paenibacillus sp. NEAU-GSW1]
MLETVIVGGARTPFGKFGGTLKHVKAVELGAYAIAGAIADAGMAKDQIDSVAMGMVLQAGAGQNPARQSAILAGLDWSITADTVNRVCASGLRAIAMADQAIRSGSAEAIAAGGMESMSNTPYAASDVRWGARMGHIGLFDLMLNDGLTCPFDQVAMAVHGNDAANRHAISRAEQDEWALRSQARAVEAIAAGIAAQEIVAVRADKGNASIAVDEGPRPNTDAAQLALLRPIGHTGGTITAGNAPGVNDGAAAVIVMEKTAARKHGLQPQATIVAHASIGMEAHQLAEAPANAIVKLLKQTGISIADIDLFEVNEAFASVVLTSGKLLSWDAAKVNVNGGAIAYGHPIGASGARIVLTLIRELKRRGGGLGIAAICSGGAQGDALLVRVDH